MKNQQELKSEEKKEITEAMIEEINIYREWFYEQTSSGHIINYLNGFTAVGVTTDMPQPSQIMICGIKINRSGNEIEEFINMTLPKDEALDLFKCLQIVLENNKEEEYKKYVS